MYILTKEKNSVDLWHILKDYMHYLPKTCDVWRFQTQRNKAEQEETVHSKVVLPSTYWNYQTTYAKHMD